MLFWDFHSILEKPKVLFYIFVVVSDFSVREKTAAGI
jgi:hypothetical protein